MQSLTKIQSFALELLKERGEIGAYGSFVGARWAERNNRLRYASSRYSFGDTAAGYKALRALKTKGLCNETETGLFIYKK